LNKNIYFLLLYGELITKHSFIKPLYEDHSHMGQIWTPTDLLRKRNL